MAIPWKSNTTPHIPCMQHYLQISKGKQPFPVSHGALNLAMFMGKIARLVMYLNVPKQSCASELHNKGYIFLVHESLICLCRILNAF